MTAEEWVGRTIAGKYRVETLLGKGGMGLVLHARHIRLDEEVAIKVLLPAMLEVQGMVTRFMREARAASKIKSPHVVRVTDVDLLEDGAPYMVMEYLEGVSLSVLRRREGKLEIATAVRYVLEACDAIAEAHSLGIIHRDLKPANLFVARGRDGASVLKVLDFGISKVDAPGDQDTTKTGQMMGSPKYMAPEQMLSMHDVDGRSDIWSLGAILYDLCAGRTPFVADTVAQLCSRVLHDKPPPPTQFRPDLPAQLEAIILRCLEREPAKRFSDVAALIDALLPFAPEETSLPPTRAPMSARTGAIEGATVVSPSASPLPAVPPSLTPPIALSPPASPRAPSVAPPSVRGATISAWDAPAGTASRSRRRTRVAAAALVIVAAGVTALVLHGRSSPPSPTVAVVTPPSPPATAAGPAGVRPPGAEAPAPPLPSAAPEPVASVNGATTPTTGPTASSTVPVRGPMPKKGPRAAHAANATPGDSDPFGGKRR